MKPRYTLQPQAFVNFLNENMADEFWICDASPKYELAQRALPFLRGSKIILNPHVHIPFPFGLGFLGKVAVINQYSGKDHNEAYEILEINVVRPIPTRDGIIIRPQKLELTLIDDCDDVPNGETTLTQQFGQLAYEDRIWRFNHQPVENVEPMKRKEATPIFA